jgi:hypothetical protein
MIAAIHVDYNATRIAIALAIVLREEVARGCLLD